MSSALHRGLPDRVPDRVAFAVVLAALPVVLTSAAFAVAPLVGLDADGVDQVGEYGVYAAANLPVLAALALCGRDRLRTLVPVERPSGRELDAAGVALAVGIGVYPVVEAINDALGLSFDGMGYSLGDPVAVAIVALGTVVVAPIAEEVLFRGVLLGTLLEREWHPVLAGGAVVVAFAAIHAPNFGAGGVLFILAWGTLPTALRLRYDDLSGAVLMHALNNAWVYLAVPILFA